uniref:Actin n=1 Tax=Caenorhabditis japonica TaxID=281687 RepID=A0A8R1HY78_CAEJA
MSGAVYGGDEVSGLVFDAGSQTFRVGFAGEEYPKGDIPSHIAVQEPVADEIIEKQEAMEEGDNSNVKTKREKNFFIGTTKIIVPRARTTMQSFMKEGLIEDWDLFEKMVEHSYENILYSNPAEHPALFTESAWNDRARREKLTELMFEKFQVPAYYLSKNAVLSCFAQGRTHGLMVDSGATQTSVVPVYDGYAVTHAVVKCAIGGDVITEQLAHMLEHQKIDLVPTYKIGTKEEVNEGDAPKWTAKKNLPEVTESYDKFMKKQVLEDMSATMLQLCDTNIDMDYVEKLPSTPYSFPNGYTKEFAAERIKLPECLFDLSYLKTEGKKEGLMTIAQMAATSANLADIDIRP